jgi:hypothetical protein
MQRDLRIVESKGQAKHTLTVRGAEACRGIGRLGRESEIHRTAGMRLYTIHAVRVT